VRSCEDERRRGKMKEVQEIVMYDSVALGMLRSKGRHLKKII